MPLGPFSGFNSSTGTGDTLISASPGTNNIYVVSTIIISNNSSTDSEVNLKSGTTILAVIPAPKNGGATITLPKPLHFNTGDVINFALTIAATTVSVTVIGVVVPSSFQYDSEVVSV